MLTTEAKRKLAAAAVFALPIVLVKATAELMTGPTAGSAAASVHVVDLQPITDAPVIPAVNDQTKRAAIRLAELRETPFGTTPFFHVPAGSDVVIPNTDPEWPEPPTFRVKVIMASARGNTALIDGSTYRVGDMLAGTEWRIVDINSDKRNVTIEDQEHGRVMTKGVNMP